MLSTYCDIGNTDITKSLRYKINNSDVVNNTIISCALQFVLSYLLSNYVTKINSLTYGALPNIY